MMIGLEGPRGTILSKAAWGFTAGQTGSGRGVRLGGFLNRLARNMKVGEVVPRRQQIDDLDNLELFAIQPNLISHLRRFVLVDDGTRMRASDDDVAYLIDHGPLPPTPTALSGYDA